MLGAIIRPLHPGVSKLLRMNAYLEQINMSFYPTENQLDFRKTGLEEFVRERVNEYRYWQSK